MGDVANKDEAFKCLDIAKEALRAGEHARAEKFASKALRLYRCSKTEAMVLQVQVHIAEMTRDGPSGRTAGPSSNGTTTGQPHTAANGTAHGSHSQHRHQQHEHQQQQHEQQQRHSSRQHHHGQQQQQQQHHNSGSTRQQQQQPRGMGSSGGLRHRGGASSPAAEEQPEDPSVTPEQRRVVQQILAATCFYEVLGVPRNAGDADIKQAYKKLALRLHPDKNKARKADEAFKLLSRAFSCLSSADKRAYYDRTGYESSAAAQAASSGAARGRGGMTGGGFYYSGSDEFDPEEIFNAFFGAGAFNPHAARVFRSQFGGFGAHPGARTRAPQGGRGEQQQQQQQHSQLMALMQILPVLLIVVVTLLSAQGEPVYSLARDAKFDRELTTARLGVPFWVKEGRGFDTSYPPGSHKRVALERQVESDVYERVYQRCQNERMAQHRAYTWGNREAARRMELAACHELGQLNERMGAHSRQQPIGVRF